MIRRITALLLFLVLAVPAGAGFAEEYVPTDQWEPPVIDEEYALANAPYLLVLKIAQEEIGYVEGPHEDETKYGEWFGDRLTAWCAEFLTWCVHEADERYGTNLMDNVYPYYGSPKNGAPWFIQRERFITSTSKLPTNTGEMMWLIGADRFLKNKEYTPHVGDYMWISYYSPKKGTDHVAIVEGVSTEPDGSHLIHVIEGNNPDSVQRNTYKQTWKLIYGYGSPVRRANRIIRKWNRSDDCKAVMAFLVQKGFLKEEQMSDQFTEKGYEALRKYQKENGINATGKVDIETRAFMEQDPDFIRILAENQR